MDRVFALLVGAFCVYAGLFVFRTSFLVGAERYFCLFDDAMISMRYAHNLATGHGLVWNPGGERIEGFTNPLWVLLMTLVHLVPLAASKTSLPVQLAGAACLVANLFVVRRIALHLTDGSSAAANGAVFLTAFYYPLVYWSLMGLEVGAITLILSCVVWRSIQRDEGAPPALSSYALLGVATWIRLDAVVLLLALLGFSVVTDRARRLRHLIHAGVALALGVGLQSVLRYGYYGEWLPNTYHLKMTGYPVAWRLARGVSVLAEFLLRSHVALLVAACAAWFVPRNRTALLLAGLIATLAGYSVYVGGDAWETLGGSNRFTSPAMPLTFVLLCAGLHPMLVRRAPGAARYAIATIALVASTAVGLNTPRGAPSLARWTLAERPPFVVAHREMVSRARKVETVTDEAAVVAVTWAGIMPYLMDRTVVDLLGKNDREIARRPMTPIPGAPRSRAFWPGHLKWDYARSIGELRPDLITALWRPDRPAPALELLEIPDDARRWVLPHYRRVTVDGTRFYVRGGSRHIRWDVLDTDGPGDDAITD